MMPWMKLTSWLGFHYLTTYAHPSSSPYSPPHSLTGGGGHPTAQLRTVPPEEGVRSTQSARATYWKRCDPSQNKVSRPTAGPLFPCQ